MTNPPPSTSGLPASEQRPPIVDQLSNSELSAGAAATQAPADNPPTPPAGPPQPRDPPEESPPTKIKSKLLENAIAVLVTAAATLLTPIRDWVNEFIWTANADVVVEGPTEAFVGDPIPLRIKVKAKAQWFKTPGGTLNVVAPGYAFEVDDCTKVLLPIQVDRSTDSPGGVFPKDKAVVLWATKEGKNYEIDVSFDMYGLKPQMTKHRVTVLAAERREVVTSKDYSGNWKIRIGTKDGTMRIVQTETQIQGTYTLLGEKTRPVNGHHDGADLELNFSQDDPDLEWHLKKSKVDIADGYLRAEATSDTPASDGKASLMKRSGSEWEPVKPVPIRALVRHRSNPNAGC